MPQQLFLLVLIALALVASIGTRAQSAAPSGNQLIRWSTSPRDQVTRSEPKPSNRFLRVTGSAPVSAAVVEGEKVTKLGPRIKQAVGRWKAKFKERSPVGTYRTYKKWIKTGSRVLGWYVAVKFKIMEFIAWIRETFRLTAAKKKSWLARRRKRANKK
ncbi:unnamed protein product [Hyaloperonospora brassicae]|uniref:RxLR effector candidate protein n=1 Tax=Hyaloperonospora brassicae TaxID=162125 RepID=A0AAV0TC12_HYABA|nr:unnamed protein product [Hyaloperonospora brassicae]